MVCIDVQRATMSLGNGRRQHLDPLDLIILYWTMARAPARRIAQAAGLAQDALDQRSSALRADAGNAWAALEAGDVTLLSGGVPRSRLPWAERHCASLLDRALERRSPEAPFITVAGGETLTLADTRRRVACIRARLRAAGLGPGAVIAVDAAPRLETLLMTFAALAHRAVLLRLGETMGRETLRGMIVTAPAHLTLTASRTALDGLRATGEIVDLADDHGREGPRSFADWLAEAPEPAEEDRVPATVDPTDPALIGFTSGSTGTPKAVVIPHEAVWRQGEATQNALGFALDDVFSAATDLTSNTATLCIVTLPVLSGGRIVLPSAAARHQPLAYALDCAAHGVTSMMIVPGVLRTLLAVTRLSAPPRLDALRLGICSTGMLDRSTAEAFRATYGTDLIDLLGAREVSTLIQTERGSGRLAGAGGGLPLENMLRLLAPDGRPAGPGEPGEAVLHSDCMMLGYMPENTQDRPARPFSTAALAPVSPWFASGDLMRHDAEGRIEIAGRARDVIKAVDGSIVYPVEVEAVLLADSAVTEACVFRSEGADGIELVAAAVIAVPEARDAALAERLQARARAALGRYKVPRHILVVDALPRVGRGKPDRRALGEDLSRTLRAAAE
ncbi:MAG: class I adenylate-forming enzyme family protein [Pseudomonadota bacterium]